jgi:hypothetical protein
VFFFIIKKRSLVVRKMVPGDVLGPKAFGECGFRSVVHYALCNVYGIFCTAGQSRKKGRVAFQERRVLRLEIFFGKMNIKMKTTSTTTTCIMEKG